MPAKKVSAASAKTATNTLCPRGRPANKKVIKSSEFIDDEAEEATNVSDDDMRSVKSVSERSRPRPVAGRAKSAMDLDDDDAMSVKSVASTNIRPRARPIARSKSSKPTDDNDIIDISSRDDAMSVKSSTCGSGPLLCMAGYSSNLGEWAIALY
ncbi:hypothetical protein PILCRDRAFT_8364 [Piloderma croceum F 1598]|uniref:Uncharacterized protein n=1 Tax=Piloderma croceum (strain F 1598) TaxID=765440 RepID=A0A0C3BWF0_PILCF|nr:hypothetical protein PILCRDRAFT_8364 [Piloderma croceum F 1598]